MKSVLNLPVLLFLLPLLGTAAAQIGSTAPDSFSISQFDGNYTDWFNFEPEAYARLYLNAMQLTPDSDNDQYANAKFNKSGRIMLKRSFRFWRPLPSNGSANASREVASFNSSFVLNITPQPNGSSIGGEGMAFVVSSSSDLPSNSYGEYLGLFNGSTNGNPGNQLVAVEFDTLKSGSFDPDDNHIGVNINRIESLKAVSINNTDIKMKSGMDFTVSIVYDGVSKNLSVYVNSGNFSFQSFPNPSHVLSMTLDLSENLSKDVYFGFSASTGINAELNCVKSWNFSIHEVEADKNNNKALIIGLSVGIILALIAGAILGVYLKKCLQKRRQKRTVEQYFIDRITGPRKFELKELKKATNNFDRRRLLGKGGFGEVYLGFLVNDIRVAVKKIKENSSEADNEFLREITVISTLRHKNLVRLLGWGFDGVHLLLVYEYMPNNSLDKHIFGKTENDTVLDCKSRYHIIQGVASALVYLHTATEERVQVLHRDIKASNVMLDSDLNARLGDFGLAKIIAENPNSSAVTSTGMAGTHGYIAPECFHTRRATAESDVYSFGTVVLEVACGRRPVTGVDLFLVDWVWALHGVGHVLDALDPLVVPRMSESDKDDMQRLLILGLACCHPAPSQRPSMRAVEQILALEMPLPEVPPAKPAFMWPVLGFSMSDICSSSSSGIRWSSSTALRLFPT